MSEFEGKERIIQEFVPGKQVTLAHVIANPDKNLYGKLGLIDATGAIGIMTITPSEGAMIAADVATKAADVKVGFVDRFNGSLVITGDVSGEGIVRELGIDLYTHAQSSVSCTSGGVCTPAFCVFRFCVHSAGVGV